MRSLRDDRSWVYALLFLTVFIAINYGINFEREILDSYIGTLPGIFFNIIFFSFAYYGMALVVAATKGDFSHFKNKDFWIKSICILAVIGFFNGYYLFPDFVNNQSNYSDYVYLFYLSNASKAWVFYLLPILIMHRFLENEVDSIYGFSFKGVAIAPYLYLLVAAAPFIIYASFLPKFQIQYPFFKPWEHQMVFESNSFGYAILFEVAYGSNFVFLEWVFRGVLVIGMARVMGKDALLPMVSAYAFLHFGKPFQETLAAIFGGYLLGILALNSKSIIGGCIIHVGIAWLMDLAAHVQHFLGARP